MAANILERARNGDKYNPADWELVPRALKQGVMLLGCLVESETEWQNQALRAGALGAIEKAMNFAEDDCDLQQVCCWFGVCNSYVQVHTVGLLGAL